MSPLGAKRLFMNLIHTFRYVHHTFLYLAVHNVKLCIFFCTRWSETVVKCIFHGIRVLSGEERFRFVCVCLTVWFLFLHGIQ